MKTNKNKQGTLILHQGDVMIIKLKKMGTGKEQPVQQNRVVLAEGEVTGHAHAFYDPNLVRFVVNEQTNKRFLEVKAEKAVLKHEEHRALEIPMGFYEIRTPVEYQPKELPRAVAD